MSIWVNGVELAAELKITKGRVTQLKNSGVFRRGLNNKFDLDECRKNFKEKRLNSPRVDRGPALPLIEQPEKLTATEKFKEDYNSQRGREPGSHYDKYMTARALSASIKAQREKKLLDEVNGRLADKNILYAAIKAMTQKNNSRIKAKLRSIPKRLALGWPNPKERAHLETTCNVIINSILTEMSEIDPGSLDEALNT